MRPALGDGTVQLNHAGTRLGHNGGIAAGHAQADGASNQDFVPARWQRSANRIDEILRRRKDAYAAFRCKCQGRPVAVFVAAANRLNIEIVGRIGQQITRIITGVRGRLWILVVEVGDGAGGNQRAPLGCGTRLRPSNCGLVSRQARHREVDGVQTARHFYNVDVVDVKILIGTSGIAESNIVTATGICVQMDLMIAPSVGGTECHRTN